jgi:hypothetical protein
MLLVGPFLRQGSFTPVLLRGPAPNGHPCPDGALAASMRLGPLRKTCVQPAPKSRLAVSGLFAYEDQKQIKSRSTTSRLKPVLQGSAPVQLNAGGVVGPASAGKTAPLTVRGVLVGPASAGKTAPLTVRGVLVGPASARKAVPLTVRGVLVGPASAGKTAPLTVRGVLVGPASAPKAVLLTVRGVLVGPASAGKAVPLTVRGVLVGPALAGKAPVQAGKGR